MDLFDEYIGTKKNKMGMNVWKDRVFRISYYPKY